MMLTDIIGWLGAFSLLLAYFSLVHKNLTSRSKTYQILNILGAIMLGVNNFSTKSYPSLLTNTIWAFIGFYGLFHIIKRFRKK